MGPAIVDLGRFAVAHSQLDLHIQDCEFEHSYHVGELLSFQYLFDRI